MHSSKIRFLAACLVLSAAGSMLAACGQDAADTPAVTAEQTESTASAAAETEPLDPLEARKLIDDGLGEHDFGGKEFRVYLTDYAEDCWIAEQETGDVINDAVFARNTAVEDRFHCRIVPTQLLYRDMSEYINKTVLANEDAIDLLSAHAVMMGQITLSDLFYNWYNVPHIDFSKPWWSPSTVRDLTYNGVCVTAIGDAAMSAMASAYCVFYNKNLGAQYDLPDMYEVVNDGRFTIDYLLSLTKEIYEDRNGDGKQDNDDLYGYTSDRFSNMNAYLWAFDNPVFKKNGDDLVFSYNTEKMPAIVETLVSAFRDNPGIHCDFSYQNAEQKNALFYSRDMFAKGLSVFANGQICMSLTHFRDLEDDFGILPYPKWDESQEQYATMADGHHEVLSVPLTISDPEFIGVITEALCAESYKTLVPAYYDVALKVKGARDTESVEMLDRIVASRVFDFGYIYDGWNGCSFFLEQFVSNRDTGFSSFFAKKEKAVMKHYSEVEDYFKNYSH